jgi:hypothetical protein
MEARSQSAAHPNEMNFIFNLNAFSWKAMQRTASRAAIYRSSVCHPHVGCESRLLGLAVADLVSR